MGLFKKKVTAIKYDKENLQPTIRSSICTGEKVAGFKDLRTGKFRDIMLIKNENDIKKFREMYGINDSSEIYKDY